MRRRRLGRIYNCQCLWWRRERQPWGRWSDGVHDMERRSRADGWRRWWYGRSRAAVNGPRRDRRERRSTRRLLLWQPGAEIRRRGRRRRRRHYVCHVVRRRRWRGRRRQRRRWPRNVRGAQFWLRRRRRRRRRARPRRGGRQRDGRYCSLHYERRDTAGSVLRHGWVEHPRVSVPSVIFLHQWGGTCVYRPRGLLLPSEQHEWQWVGVPSCGVVCGRQRTAECLHGSCRLCMRWRQRGCGRQPVRRGKILCRWIGAPAGLRVYRRVYLD